MYLNCSCGVGVAGRAFGDVRGVISGVSLFIAGASSGYGGEKHKQKLNALDN
jgi:hypothetical protein